MMSTNTLEASPLVPTSPAQAASRRTLGRSLLLAAALAFSIGVPQAAVITTQGTWTTTLQGRDAAGNPVDLLSGGNPNPALKYVYDSVLELTWLADWNVNGAMNWATANAWAAGLTDFGGGWVLPSVLDTGAAGCVSPTARVNNTTDCGYNVYGGEVGRRDSPLAHMYYDTLGNMDSFGDLGLVNTGPFSNMQKFGYWTDTTLATNVNRAWEFELGRGQQTWNSKVFSYFAVAVREGDVFTGAVPEPGTLALLGLSFGAMVMARRRRTH